eukprot:21563_5
MKTPLSSSFFCERNSMTRNPKVPRQSKDLRTNEICNLSMHSKHAARPSPRSPSPSSNQNQFSHRRQAMPTNPTKSQYRPLRSTKNINSRRPSHLQPKSCTMANRRPTFFPMCRLNCR